MAFALVTLSLLATFSDGVFGKHARRVADPLGLGSKWCVNENEQFIPGTLTLSGTPPVDCSKVNADWTVTVDPVFWGLTPCQVVQEIMRLIALISPTTPIPQCDSQGLFLFRLCVEDGEVCWCIDKTGKEVNGTWTPAGTPPVNCSNPFLNETASINIDLALDADPAFRKEMRYAAPDTKHQTDLKVLEAVKELTDFGDIFDEEADEEDKKTGLGAQMFLGEKKNKLADLSHDILVEDDEDDLDGHIWMVDKEGNALLESSCEAARLAALPGEYLPECEQDGSWSPLQCFASNCFCVTNAGVKIPGTACKLTLGKSCNCPAVSPGLTDCQRQQAIAEAMVVVPPGYFVPECAADGSFLPIQCSHSSGFCWCVNEDGREIPETARRPGSKPLDCSQNTPSPSPAP